MKSIITIPKMMEVLRKEYNVRPKMTTSSRTGQSHIRFSARNRYDLCELICKRASASGNWSAGHSVDDEVVLTPIMTERVEFSDGIRYY